MILHPVMRLQHRNRSPTGPIVITIEIGTERRAIIDMIIGPRKENLNLLQKRLQNYRSISIDMDHQILGIEGIQVNIDREEGAQVIHHPQDRLRVDTRPVVDLSHLLAVQAHIPVPVRLDLNADMGMGMDMEEGTGGHK